MTMIDPARLLAVWESGARRHPIDRALLLFALARPEDNPDGLADAPLGERNAAIMALRQACFGRRLPAWLDCPECGERMEFELDPAQLPPLGERPPEPVRVAGYRFRAPTSRDLLVVAGEPHPDRAVIKLLRACLEAAPDTDPEDDDLAPLIDNVGEALEASDPWADLALAMPCPACGAEVTADFDIARYFWDELDRHAHALLDDVHTLAAAYGWTEPQILALSGPRRAAYLARARA